MIPEEEIEGMSKEIKIGPRAIRLSSYYVEKSISLTDIEKDRVLSCIESALLRRWDLFELCSDDDFLNSTSMREQFYDTPQPFLSAIICLFIVAQLKRVMIGD